MREIKFRAWIKKEKKMVFSRFYFSAFGHQIINFYEDEATVESFYNEEDFILMQFTGLKDRKKKEIYEGDIIKYSTPWFMKKDGEIAIDVVVFENCGFKVDGLDLGIPHWVGKKKGKYEIIGNIYENPKLLR